MISITRVTALGVATAPHPASDAPAPAPIVPRQVALSSPPRERTRQQWADIKAMWEDRQGQPQLLMQQMLEHGFDAADLAYATGQSVDDLNLYLIVNGAPAGFANSTPMDRQAVERHFMQSLRQALGAGLSIDQFTTQYLQSSSLEGRVFSQFHGSASTVALDVGDAWGPATPTVTQFSRSGATLAGIHRADGSWTVQWELKSRLATLHPRGSERQRAEIDAVLTDPVNQQIVARHSASFIHAPAMQGLEPRLAAFYGAERFARMLRLQHATDKLRAAYANAPRPAPPALKRLKPNGDAALGPVTGSPGWLCVGKGWAEPDSSDRHPAVYAFECEAQAPGRDSDVDLLFNAVHGGIVTVDGHEPAHGGDAAMRHFTLDGLFELIPPSATGTRPGCMAPAYQSGLFRLDPARPPELFDPEVVWFDPAVGFVTSIDNIIEDLAVPDSAIPLAMAGLVVCGMAKALPGLTAGSALAGSVDMGIGMMGHVSLPLSTGGRLTLNGLVQAALARAVGHGSGSMSGQGAISNLCFLGVTGMGTLRRALNTAAEGRFIDGFTAALASGVATEVVRAFGMEIHGLVAAQQITGEQAGFLRVLSKVLGGAIRALVNPVGRQYAFAADLVRGLLADVEPDAADASTPAGDPSVNPWASPKPSIRAWA